MSRSRICNLWKCEFPVPIGIPSRLGNCLSGMWKRARRSHPPDLSQSLILGFCEMNVTLVSSLTCHPSTFLTPWLTRQTYVLMVDTSTSLTDMFPCIDIFHAINWISWKFLQRGNKLMDCPYAISGLYVDLFGTIDNSLNLSLL